MNPQTNDKQEVYETVQEPMQNDTEFIQIEYKKPQIVKKFVSKLLWIIGLNAATPIIILIISLLLVFAYIGGTLYFLFRKEVS